MIKLEDISTNRRERNFSQSFHEFGIDVGRKDILPGHYYQFNVPVPNFNPAWIPQNSEEYKENPDAYITNREYYDLSPTGLVFAHNRWNHTALVLNLKILPPTYRAAVILAHLNLIESNLERLNALPWIKEETVPFSLRRKMNLALYQVTPSILQKATGIKLGYAISGYKLDKIATAKLMDWDNIGELPLANIDQRGLVISPGLLGIDSIFNNFENKQMT